MNEIFKDKYTFKEAWINYTKDITGIEDREYLNKKFTENYNERNIGLYNSANGTSTDILGLQLARDMTNNYIFVENGVLFLKHEIKTSPIVTNITILKQFRNNGKAMMKKAIENQDAIGEAFYNLMQNSDKTSINTYYGGSLNAFGKYYNFDVASSTTIRGRSTVSMNGLTLEMAFGSYRPYSVRAIAHFITNSKDKDISKHLVYLTHVPTNEEILRHLLKDHYDGYYAINVLNDMINKLTDTQRKAVFYTSNFDAISKLPIVKELILKSYQIQNDEYYKIHELNNANDSSRFKKYKDILFLNPMSVPEKLKGLLDVLIDMIYDLITGFYWYEGDYTSNGSYLTSTQEIFKGMQREIVVLTDTDSLIAFLELIMRKISSYPEFASVVTEFDSNMLNYTVGSIVIAIFSKMIDWGLARYTLYANIGEKYRGLISYKQEFFFRTFQVTIVAKNYLGMIGIQEGIFLPEEKIDIKGLAMKKSNFNKKLSKLAQDISINMIAKVDKPDIPAILNKIEEYRNDIKRMYKSTKNIELFTVLKVKSKYGVLPEGEHRIKACRLYNALFNNEIPLPGAFLVANITFEERLDILAENYPREYEILKKVALDRMIVSNKESVRNKFLKENITEEELDTLEEHAFRRDILAKLDTATNYDDIKAILGAFKKEHREYNSITYKKIDVVDIKKIAIPLESEEVPDFITEFIDSDDLDVFENLASIIVKGVGLETVRNKKKRQLITNIVSYY